MEFGIWLLKWKSLLLESRLELNIGIDLAILFYFFLYAGKSNWCHLSHLEKKSSIVESLETKAIHFFIELPIKVILLLYNYMLIGSEEENSLKGEKKVRLSECFIKSLSEMFCPMKHLLPYSRGEVLMVALKKLWRFLVLS